MSFDLCMPVCSERVQSEERRPVYEVWALFAPEFRAFSEREDRALNNLRRDLQVELNGMGKGLDHERLAELSFRPQLTARRLTLNLTLRRRTIKGDFFLVSYEALDRRIVLCPRIEDFSFELLRGQDLQTRATEVLTAHFKQLEKRGLPIELDTYLANRHSRVTDLEFSVRVAQRYVPEADRPFAFLGGGQKMSGAEELGRTGRCLNRLYPNDLERAILRDSLVEDLVQHFGDKKLRGVKRGQSPRPLVLVGPSQAGKTAIVHEFLRRRLDSEEFSRRELWHLNPQRLISGMSYVGQWEERVLAIFEESATHKHLLYFDDLLGLFQAGKSRDSDLTIGHVLKGFLEDARLRVVAEAIPEAWRKLRELDRGFADFFRVVHVREPTEAETLRILIRSVQEMESRFRCEFHPAVLPLVLQLQRRYVRTRSFPGKAVEMLRQLGAAHEDWDIDVFDVYEHFQNKTGIRQQFLDPENGVTEEGVREFFGRRIVGQEAAIKAMVDAVVACGAQMNDPTRPLASLLFLGPTGVGKTECVKALAQLLFRGCEPASAI